MMAVNADVAVALGEIGRTERRDRDCSGSGFYVDREQCTTRLDPQDPTITITHTWVTSVENDVLDKIGRTSGWTWGVVTETCEDIAGESKVRILCADVVRMLTGDGDSGAPVFEYYSDGTAEFRGIVYANRDHRASDDFGRETIFQDLEQIERDLGSLTVVDAGSPVVRIEGPRAALRGETCTWTTRTWGLSPFSYEWSGILRGSSRSITGVVNKSGWLRVTITDPLGRTASDSLDVIVGIGPCDGDDPDDTVLAAPPPPVGS